MLFSYKELKKLANLPQEITPEEVAKAITSIGFEVEGVENFLDVEGIKFGKVKKITKNPNADKLLVCEIEFSDKTRTIQTNATNLVEGNVVIGFVPGARVGDVTFSEKELQGVLSEGMLSAPSEFGIDKDLCREDVISGIAVYDEITDLSIDPVEYLGLNDHIIEVDILSNRSDANSYYVMAMELAAKFKTEVSLPEIKNGNIDSNLKVKGEEIVVMEAKNDTTITIKEQIFLNKHGVKAINDGSDLTNLTLLYTGQPTHAYDGSKVGTEFEVKDYSGKAIVFGNKEVELKDDQVVFIDGKPECVASVIGFNESGVSESTDTLKLEMGIFNISGVRKAVKAVKLNSAASSQGSKKLTKGTTDFALRFITNRIENFSNPINMPKLQNDSISYDVNVINKLAGSKITETSEFKSVLESLEILGFKISNDKISIPVYRHDVKNMEDIAEEVFRFYGYDNFKAIAPIIAPFKVISPENYTEPFINKGYQEVKTYSLISEEKNIINPFSFKNIVKLSTFVSKEREVVRSSQALSLEEVAEYNIKRGMKEISIVGNGMIGDEMNSVALLSNQKSFSEIKQDIINQYPDVSFERLENEMLHPGVSAKILLDGEMIGWIGKIHPKYSKVDAFIAEILTAKVSKKDIHYKKYDDKPLKFEDITIPLENKEDLNIEMENYKEAYSVKVIDEYKDQDGTMKITIRVVK